MFSKTIETTPFSAHAVGELFENIVVSNAKDVSFLSTVRALLMNRLNGEQKRFELNVQNFRKNTAQIQEASTAGMLECMVGVDFLQNTDNVVVCNIASLSEESRAAAFEAIDNAVAEDLKSRDFTEITDLRQFLRQKNINSRFYINNNNRISICVVERMDIRIWHVIQAFFPKYTPWYFADAPLDNDETELLKSLTNRYAPQYEHHIAKIFQKLGIRERLLRDQLKNFEVRFEQQELRRSEQTIRDIEGQITHLRTQITEYINKYREEEYRKEGIKYKIAHHESSELTDYLIRNKSIRITNITGSKFEFEVMTDVSNIDPDQFDVCIRNKDSFFFKPYSDAHAADYNGMSNDDKERLCRAIFENEILRLNTCAALYVDFERCRIGSDRDYTFPDDIQETYIPNQHFYNNYTCFGGNEAYIYSAINEHDYIGAFEQMLASVKNMNFSEPHVSGYFMRHVYKADANKCIKLPDGTNVTPHEALAWLDEQNKED